ncbi:MAG: sigma-54-dependent Fis family transcriptional regulator [Lentisphaerae bacterium]|nr:MAG: sigma-54-dependent Fis family transcriptional regulator [Lentisphaerota bacterium]
MRLPDIDGLDLLDKLAAEAQKQSMELPPVIVISAYGSLEVVARAMQGKAVDYLPKPIDLDAAANLVERILAQSRENLFHEPEKSSEDTLIVGESPAMQKVFKQIGLVARTSANVLIIGPTGAGKELVAQAIHKLSARRNHPFVAVNCGALPENLVESELFGHERGAFTGANSSRAGRFELAHGGTLFLDEIAELPLNAQVKLLRVLDTQLIERLGSVESRSVDVRIIAATNRTLEEEVSQGRFREDLFFRLNVIRIDVPPLRERPEDIVPLVRHFLKLFGNDIAITESALKILQRYGWPGNVRELRNAIQHAVVLAGEGPLLPEHLPRNIREGNPLMNSTTGPETLSRDQLARWYVETICRDGEIGTFYRKAIEGIEKELITQALKHCSNQNEAAEWLGLHRNTLRYKIKDLNITS